MLFSWMLPVFRTGANKVLELEDLPQQRYRAATLRNKLQTSSLRGVVHAFWKETTYTAALMAFSLLCSYTGPYLVYNFVDSLALGKSKRRLLGLVLMFLISRIGELVCERNRFFQLQLMSLRIRSCLSMMVYSKGLRSGCAAESSRVNYIATDVDQASCLPWCLHTPWALPLELGLAVFVLEKTVGRWIAAASIVVVGVCSAVKAWKLAASQERMQKSVAKARDDKMRCAVESLKYMKTLKLHAWEGMFLEKLLQLRGLELDGITKLVFLENVGRHLSWSIPALVLLLMFSACIAAGRTLSAKAVLSAVATSQIISGSLQEYIGCVPIFTKAKVSLHRLHSFLREPEVSGRQPEATLPPGSIVIRGGTFSWDASTKMPAVIENLDLEVEPGSVLGVCGPVGSGKSSVLSCILGEIPRISGNVQVSGTVAYVPQSPWIRNCSIQENILFGKPMERSGYERAIQVCQLVDDLRMLRDGDQTQVGDRGENLSGGQKQRLQLARAVYADADIYLLDDPLSSVDSNTASRIVEECIYGALRSKTIVIATHQKEIFRSLDNVLVLDSGRIIRTINVSCPAPQLQIELPASSLEPEVDVKPGTTSLLQEDRKRGAVHSSVYRSYLVSIPEAGVLLSGMLATHFAFQLIQIASSWWLAANSSSSPFLVGCYMLLSFASCLFLALRLSLVSRFGLAASQHFFTRLSGLAFSTIEFLIILYIMSQVPFVLVVAVPVAFACLYLQRYYASSIRELPRLIAIFQAPVVHQFEESLAGASVIRAFGKQDFLLNEFVATLDCSLRPVFYNFSAMECLALHTGLLVNAVLVIFMLALVAFPTSNNTASVGVAITYALRLNAIQCSLVWDLCDAEKRIVAVERILQYTDMNSEAEWHLDDCQSLIDWPSLGEIELDNLEARYRPGGPLILKGITCRIPGGRKTSIIGRTGSGKSTLISCLFRIVEPGKNQIFIDGVDTTSVGLHDLRSMFIIIPQEPVMFEGSIRHNLDPLGLNSNDNELWEVLDKCHLFEDVSRSELKLESAVAANGGNWSAGQRQLFCLARILLNRKSQAKILVSDEATAYVDNASRKVINSLVDKEFCGMTTLNITHHLESIGENDLVLHLSNGELIGSTITTTT